MLTFGQSKHGVLNAKDTLQSIQHLHGELTTRPNDSIDSNLLS